jgi:hypothetical protein
MVGCIVVAYTNPCSVLVGSSQFSETILITPFKVADVSVILVTAEVVSVGLYKQGLSTSPLLSPTSVFPSSPLHPTISTVKNK